MVSSRKKKGMKRERNARTSRSDTYLCSLELHYRATLLNITSRTNTPHSGNNIPPRDTETDLRLPVLTAFSTALHFLLSRAKSTAIQITFVPLSVRKANTSIVRFAIRELERSRKNRFATFRDLSANSNISNIFFLFFILRDLRAIFARYSRKLHQKSHRWSYSFWFLLFLFFSGILRVQIVNVTRKITKNTKQKSMVLLHDCTFPVNLTTSLLAVLTANILLFSQNLQQSSRR